MHSCNIRVYYEDTDAGGIVYYANYLKFAERARSEFLRAKGITNSQMIDSDNMGIVVRHVSADLKSPARLDDLLTVETSVVNARKASFEMLQEISCGGLHLVTIIVKLACIDLTSGRPVPIPSYLQEILSQ